MLKHVMQRKSTDCGVACISAITGESRNSVLKVLGLKESSPSHRTGPEQIRAALENFQFRMHKEVICDNWEKFPGNIDLALLAVNYNEDKNTWHWVVYDKTDPISPILDPRSKNRRPWHYKTRLFSYYRIEPI